MTAAWSHGVYTCVLLCVQMNVVPSWFFEIAPKDLHLQLTQMMSISLTEASKAMISFNGIFQAV